MACPSVTTGNAFLVQTLSHLDCQAQTLGSFGFQSLASPGSPAALALTALLTLFVALYGVRLLFGPSDEPRDLVKLVLRAGIVLTIALSWPAWRIAAYDTVLYGPAEIAASIMPSTLPDPRQNFPQRLQTVDTAIAVFTAEGTGRQTGKVIDQGPASGFRPVALEDDAGLAWSRTIFLASTIGSLAMLRIAGGLLLALAPLLAGLLLFDMSRGLFVGWLRGLALVALGSLGITVLLAVEVAILEPWLADILNKRGLGYATPTAPTELLAMVIAFAVAATGLLVILGKVAFQNVWTGVPVSVSQLNRNLSAGRQSTELVYAGTPGSATISRAAAISESVAHSLRREEALTQTTGVTRRIAIGSDPSLSTSASAPSAPLGSGYRRHARRETGSQQQRDKGA